jgi:hypothetical protein
MYPKPLLVFAHPGEAQSFLKAYSYQALASNFPEFIKLYETNEHYLLICGEGKYLSLQNISIIFSLLSDKISIMINLGICACLDTHLKKYDLFQIRTCYGYGQTPQFHSFTSSQTLPSLKALDCLTVENRVKLKEDKQKYSAFAPLLDRELWSLAYASQKFKIPWMAIKTVSDILNENTQCQNIFEEAAIYSQNLLSCYQEIYDQKPQTEKVSLEQIAFNHLLQNQFYFTQSQKHRFFDLWKKLTLLHPGLEISEFINEVINNAQKQKHKVKTQKLLKLLELKLNPWLYQLNQQLNKTLKPYQSEQFQIEVPLNRDEKKINFHLTCLDSEDWKKVQLQINEFPFDKIDQLLEGNLDD